MADKKQKINLFINSLGIFLSSFFLVKISIILVKLFTSWGFNIDTKLVNFRLMGISPASSDVWTTPSVFSFYSVDIYVSIFFLVLSLISFKQSSGKSTKTAVGYLWLGFSAMHSIFAGIMAGIVTKSNVFHFLQWMYIPYFVMMPVAIAMPLFMFGSGWVYNRNFLITMPATVTSIDLKASRTIMFYSFFLPVIAGLILLTITVSFNFKRYDFYELFSLIILAFPSMLYLNFKDQGRRSYNYSDSAFFIPLISGIIFCIIFFIIVAVTRL